MAGGFSFPPPPPPPPKPASGPDQRHPQYGPQQRGRGGRGRGDYESRGRGQNFGRGGQNFRGRGNANMTPLNQDGNQRGDGSWRGSREANGYSESQYRGSMDHTENGSGFPPGAYVNPNFTGNGKASRNAPNLQPYKPHTSWTGHSHHDSHPAASSLTTQYNPRTAAGHKRKLDALRGPQEPREKKPGPPAAPSVPSFGAPILPMSGNAPSAQLNGHQASMARDQSPKPAAKSLGLTPGDNAEPENLSDSAEEDNDVDEEAQYAELGTKLTVEHNGEVISLNNAADLAVWREERRRKWPTSNRVAEKEDDRKRIGAERKRLLATAAGIHRFPRSRKLEPRLKTTTRSTDAEKTAELETHAPAPIEPDEQNARRGLIKVVEASATQFKETGATNPPSTEAQLSSDATRPSLIRNQSVGKGTGKDVESAPLLPGISTENTEDEGDAVDGAPEQAGSPSSSSSDSSSDSDSESDSDGSPEQSSTKQPGPAASHAQKPVCRYFAASGSCRDGDTCRFRHELSARAPAAALNTNQQASRPAYDKFAPKLDQPSETGGKSIHERLVEQEQLEQDRLTLQAIKALGEAGFFNASSTNVY